MIHGYKLPPQELTPQRIASLQRSLEQLIEQRNRAFTETHYNDLSKSINSIRRALQGENL